MPSKASWSQALLHRLRDRVGVGRSFAPGVWVAVVTGLLVFALAPARAAAEEACTDTWTGAAKGGLWKTAADWSTGKVPTSTDVVCIENAEVYDGPTPPEEGLKYSYAKDLRLTKAELEVGVWDDLSVSAVAEINGSLDVGGKASIGTAKLIGGSALEGDELTVEQIEGSEGTVRVGRELDLTGTSTSRAGTLKFARYFAGQIYHSDAKMIVSKGFEVEAYATEDDVVRKPGFADPFGALAVEEKGLAFTGSGEIVIQSGAEGLVAEREQPQHSCLALVLSEQKLVNEGTLTFHEGDIVMANGAVLENYGTFNDNSESACRPNQIALTGETGEVAPSIVNYGQWKKTAGSGTTWVDVPFTDHGEVKEEHGHIIFGDHRKEEEEREREREAEEQFGLGGGGSGEGGKPGRRECFSGKPVNCATGNEVDEQTDLSIGGRGPTLEITRTYNSMLAVKASASGPFGYGWTGPYSAHISFGTRFEGETGKPLATVYDNQGNATRFELSEENYEPVAPLVQATLKKEGSDYIYTLPDQTQLEFNSEGELAKETERDGNSNTLTYKEGKLEKIEDSAKRALTLKYNGQGLVESIKDSMGHEVKYTYLEKQLASVTLEGKERWKFEYESPHLLKKITDGRGHSTTIKYEATTHRVTEEEYGGHKRKWKYTTLESGSETTITEPNGAETHERFNSLGEPTKVTRAKGTGEESTTEDEYNTDGELVKFTDPNKHVWTYGYDEEGNKTSEKNPSSDEWKWKYNKKHELESETTPRGETTTYKLNANGNPEEVSRTVGGKTQKTTYKYGSHQEVLEETNPLEGVTKYTYDTAGDKESETNPDGDKRTWAYNEDGQVTSTVSPRGNVGGGDPAAFTTSIERNEQGWPISVTEPETSGAPVDKSKASVSGYPQEGEVLYGAAGVWQGAPPLSYTYQWQRCNSAGESCANVSEATGSSYALSSGDVGDTLRVVVTARNVSGNASDTSAPTGVVSGIGPVYSSQFGSSGSGNGQFDHPGGVAVDTSGNIWVADEDNYRIEKFSSSGVFVGAYGSKGTGSGEFEGPWGVAVNDSNGNVYVTDPNNNRVEEFNSSGTFVRTFGFGVSNGKSEFEICTSSCQAGLAGSGQGQFNTPTAITVDASSNVWVVDAENDRVEEFNEKGEYLSQFGSKGSSDGQFTVPEGVAVDGEDVYVTDAGDDRVEEFSSAGAYLRQWGSKGNASGQFDLPLGISVSPANGDVYVADRENHRIEVFSNRGAFLSEAGTYGTSEGHMSGPVDVAVTSSESVYVTDEYNAWVSDWLVVPESSTFTSSVGSYGSENGQFHFPVGVALDGSGDQWVTDYYNDRVQEFSPSGTFIEAYGSWGSGDGELIEPVGIAINTSAGDVYIGDQKNNRIEELKTDGEFVRAFGFGVSDGKEEAEVCTSACRAGIGGSAPGQLDRPGGIALDAEGSLWVADELNNRIEKFSSSGSFIASYGSAGTGNGQFKTPAGVASGFGRIYVSDYGNNRVEVFSTSGEYLGQFGAKGTSAGDFEGPTGIAIGSSGRVYVADSGNNRIEEFTLAGQYLASFGSSGSGADEMASPEGLAVDNKGHIWITDLENDRLDQWQASGTPSNIALPAVSGDLLNGQTLAASVGAWSATPDPTYNYQWKRCNSSGESCTNISGATDSTYTLGSADVGDMLRVTVTATNTAGSAESTSAATEVVPGPRVTKYTYDGNGDVETVTDPEGHTTKYEYNAENLPTKVEEPNKDVTETEYDAMGQMIAQVDGNKHKTEYKRNLLEEVTEEINPLGKKTLKKYDKAGNLETLEDPEKHTTTYKYNESNRLTEVKYSTGKPATIKYEYNEDGKVTKMTDGTGESFNKYDELDRLTETENGHKEVVKYEYNLANEPTKITYPNEKAITRAYDKAGYLEKVTDWNGKETKFSYNPDSELEKTVFPSETKDEDTYAYNDADQMSGVTMLKGTETLASLSYARNDDGQVTGAVSKGLPGEEKSVFEYDPNNRLTKGAGVAYEYDGANNPTKIGTGTYKYNSADQLETGPSLTYTYSEDGQRTKTKPSSGPATTYGYDQAGELTSVERPKEGEVSEIKDSYAYNGEGLRTSETISGTTNYLTWDTAEELPLLLSNSNYSFIYGPGGLPIEQISSGGATSYLHHDQQGSTRLITGSAGTVTGKCTYNPYGIPTCEGTTSTPLGYDAQYTNTDTGLIYLRARVYDPSTAQFLSVDPLEVATREPYAYGADNPLSYQDRSGLGLEGVFEEGFPSICIWPACGPTPSAKEGVEQIGKGITEVAEGIEHGAESVISWITGENESSDENTEQGQSEGDCGQIPTGSKPPGAAYRDLEQETGLSRGALSDALHSIKYHAGLSANDSTRIDSEGNVYNTETGEWIGNIIDEAHG